jgi:Homeodomain-like domain
MMRELRELLTLHFDQGSSQRAIARSVGVVRSTVERTLHRFSLSGLSWPLSADVDDVGLALAVMAQVCTKPSIFVRAFFVARHTVYFEISGNFVVRLTCSQIPYHG